MRLLPTCVICMLVTPCQILGDKTAFGELRLVQSSPSFSHFLTRSLLLSSPSAPSRLFALLFSSSLPLHDSPSSFPLLQLPLARWLHLLFSGSLHNRPTCLLKPNHTGPRCRRRHSTPRHKMVSTSTSAFIHPFIHSYIHMVIHTSIRPFIHSIPLFIHPLIHPLIHPSIYPSSPPSLPGCLPPSPYPSILLYLLYYYNNIQQIKISSTAA